MSALPLFAALLCAGLMLPVSPFAGLGAERFLRTHWRIESSDDVEALKFLARDSMGLVLCVYALGLLHVCALVWSISKNGEWAVSACLIILAGAGKLSDRLARPANPRYVASKLDVAPELQSESEWIFETWRKSILPSAIPLD